MPYSDSTSISKKVVREAPEMEDFVEGVRKLTSSQLRPTYTFINWRSAKSPGLKKYAILPNNSGGHFGDTSFSTADATKRAFCASLLSSRLKLLIAASISETDVIEMVGVEFKSELSGTCEPSGNKSESLRIESV
jgi:hypothetical protein